MRQEPAVIVMFEHPEWQRPLFEALDKRRISHGRLDLKRAAFTPDQLSTAPLYFNQASPSAYLRGHARAVPFALACMRHLESRGARVLNGSRAFALELSKSAQLDLFARLGIAHPRSVVFNDVGALAERTLDFTWPALLKPDQGGSGARMFLVESQAALRRLLDERPELWLPDNLLLLQEYFPPNERGVVRIEMLGGEMLYAMRIVSHGSFNLCPSEVCHPEGDGETVCDVAPVEFFPFPEVPDQAVEHARRIFVEGGLDIGGIEYLEARDGRLVFYDVNANSNLRPAIARSFGFDPFDRVVDFLERRMRG